MQRLGFLIDWRTFRPQVRLGSITQATTAAYLQRMLDRLQSYTGPAWTCHEVALLAPATSSDPTKSLR